MLPLDGSAEVGLILATLIELDARTDEVRTRFAPTLVLAAKGRNTTEGELV